MSELIISCRNIWKLFGADPEGLLKSHGGNPDPVAIAESDHIAAVRNANLEIRTGEILVIMGLSGSGKSTLVRCLSRLIEPTSGEIFFQGKNLLEATSAEMIELRRHKMGMVFQHFALFPHRTVVQNVAFPLEVQGVKRGGREAKAREIIELVGLKGRERYYPRELSGGQQQRVGIARSLAVDPDVWFLDEPFSALDPLIRREMQNEFLRLQSLLKKTIVFITHDFDEAIRLADRIVIMYEGAIDQIGTAEELLTSPATDYVREFTKDVAREKLLTVASVMSARAGVPIADTGNGISVQRDDKLAAVAGRVIRHGGQVPVLDETGTPVGVITGDRILDALYGADV
ncbi:MAG: betaine/proline/choline family ABC transporter ATP-binding protein [Pseudomonadota bacterium]